MTELGAHGLGGSTDLPIPFTYALIGASWALTLSFVVVAFAWKSPKLDPDGRAIALPGWVTRGVDARATRFVGAAAGLAFTALVAVEAFAGPQDRADNAVPGVIYVLLWVGLVVVSLLFGPVWRLISPVRALHRLLCAGLRRPPDRGLIPYPEGWGYRPAVIGLFAFVWLELASPDPGSIVAVRNWCLAYLVVTFVGALVCGEKWCERGDPFEVYSTLASRLSPWSRDRESGAVVLRSPLDNLGSLPIRAGTVALMATLLGSTAFDSFTAFPWWMDLVDSVPSGPTATAVRTLGLLCFVAVVGLTFRFAARAAGGVDDTRRRALPGLFAPSLIPIVLGYVFAHYLTYLVEKGQQTVFLLVGADGAEVSYVLSENPGVVATGKVAFVVIGHVLGVIAAHDTALRVLPRRHRLTGQLTMLLVMVFYTFGGLYLLFGG
ncbi:hypothetical protein G4H71_00585 [Rhodococcus triatomae]|uniref:Fenitrothion hydrolase n=1 Tax=Rhodococcus triatomae TaxID=300028 RepID=A0A1G8CUJ2_9NOCA|nr:hypothetical protein [Rhodococcus triatomae]QNG18576.1 hypothetical protein G4H72_07465 [Rhodococcus triatomae]QNG21755.1 hypothetical protein G4H71_00585 [Rhodococcus triatomae]SDH49118.1 hypothetical protein SAMN05444695_102119 [Rhodococcus triatomae]